MGTNFFCHCNYRSSFGLCRHCRCGGRHCTNFICIIFNPRIFGYGKAATAGMKWIWQNQMNFFWHNGISGHGPTISWRDLPGYSNTGYKYSRLLPRFATVTKFSIRSSTLRNTTSINFIKCWLSLLPITPVVFYGRDSLCVLTPVWLSIGSGLTGCGPRPGLSIPGCNPADFFQPGLSPVHGKIGLTDKIRGGLTPKGTATWKGKWRS